NNNGSVTGNGSTTVQFRGIVRVNELNIRASAGTNGTRVGSYNYGARVEFFEKSGNWGRTEKGWICLDYVYQDGTTGSKTATGTVTGNGLNIRSGPGTGYGTVGSLNKGDRVSILEQFTYNGTTWGCTKNGWISLDFVELDGGNNNTNNNNGDDDEDTSIVATITGNNVNIRSGPGTNYEAVGTLNKGDRVTLITRQTVNGVVWGNIAEGWICMDFAKVN
ncbi:MAG: SH3 domain-containing protein, partial [Oscillospiraceae bacterium]|nr:SH3 domain-containing protein [Oscillospiraceae bacterium]